MGLAAAAVTLMAATLLMVGAASASADADLGGRVGPGEAIITASEKKCTLGFVFIGSDGAPAGLTAAHCGSNGDAVSTKSGVRIGTIVARGADDVALVRFLPGIDVRAGVPHGGRYRVVEGVVSLDEIPAGATICTYGDVTGESCGVATGRVGDAKLYERTHVDHGDSGGPVFLPTADGGVTAVGVISGFLTHDPTTSVGESISSYVTQWALRTGGAPATAGPQRVAMQY